MTPDTPRFTVRPADWPRDAAAVRTVRQAVFVVEQKVPPELEWDGNDAQCMHVLAEVDGVPVGTGRLLPDGHIGRMAVLRPWRGQGVGSAMLAMLLELAQARGHTQAILHSQSHALDFYMRAGFRVTGDEFIEAGIPHRRMLKTLD